MMSGHNSATYSEERANLFREIIAEIETAKQVTNDGQTAVARGFKRIEKECAFDTKSAKLVHSLYRLEENKRNIFLRDFLIMTEILGMTLPNVMTGLFEQDADAVESDLDEAVEGVEDDYDEDPEPLTTAYSSGFTAFQDGEDRSANPYAPDEDGYNEWRLGFQKAEHQAGAAAE